MRPFLSPVCCMAEVFATVSSLFLYENKHLHILGLVLIVHVATLAMHCTGHVTLQVYCLFLHKNLP